MSQKPNIFPAIICVPLAHTLGAVVAGLFVEGKMCERTDEAPEFDASHFPECPAQAEDGICTCDAIERDLRDAFRAMSRECF